MFMLKVSADASVCCIIFLSAAGPSCHAMPKAKGLRVVIALNVVWIEETAYGRALRSC